MHYKAIANLCFEIVGEMFPRFSGIEPKFLHQADQEEIEMVYEVFRGEGVELRIDIQEKNEELDFPHSRLDVRFLSSNMDLQNTFEGVELFAPEQIQLILKSCYGAFNAIATTQEDCDIE